MPDDKAKAPVAPASPEAETKTAAGKGSELRAPAKPVETAPAKKRGRKFVRLVLLVIVPAIALSVAAFFYLTGGRYVGTDDAFTKADTLPVSADVSARVVAIEVHDNQQVEKGQVLFRLDDETFRIALQKAEGKLTETKNNLTALQATYRQKVTDLGGAKAQLTFAQSDFNRQAALAAQGYAAKQKLDDTKRALDMARQTTGGDQQAIDAIVAQLGGDPDKPVEQQAAYLQALAERDQAALDLRHTVVVAPSAGTVGQVPSLQVGMYLTAGTQAFTLVRTDAIWVEANMKETDLTYVRPGQEATITIDTYPDRSWKAKVTSLSPASGNELSVLPAQNATGNWVKVVQRIPVRLEIETQAGDPPLSTGMSAVVSIDTGHRRHLPFVTRALAGSGQD
jgi:membrane fusion protein, multidrug efflux system